MHSDVQQGEFLLPCPNRVLHNQSRGLEDLAEEEYVLFISLLRVGAHDVAVADKASIYKDVSPFSQKKVWKLHLLVKNRVIKHVIVLGSSRKPRLDVDQALVPVTHNEHVDLGLALATHELVVLPLCEIRHRVLPIAKRVPGIGCFVSLERMQTWTPFGGNRISSDTLIASSRVNIPAHRYLDVGTPCMKALQSQVPCVNR